MKRCTGREPQDGCRVARHPPHRSAIADIGLRIFRDGLRDGLRDIDLATEVERAIETEASAIRAPPGSAATPS